MSYKTWAVLAAAAAVGLYLANRRPATAELGLEYQAAIAAAAGLASGEVAAGPAPTPKVPRAECTECGGTGVVGDGVVQVPCGNCYDAGDLAEVDAGPGAARANVRPEVERLGQSPAAAPPMAGAGHWSKQTKTYGRHGRRSRVVREWVPAADGSRSRSSGGRCFT
jgi:hypothetical protein